MEYLKLAYSSGEENTLIWQMTALSPKEVKETGLKSRSR